MKRFFYTLLLFCFIHPSWATTFTVSNTNDTGAGSLRQAITDANADGSATAASPHIINISVAGTIFVNTALDNITNHITINGHSAGSRTERATANFHRIFTIVGAVTVELNQLIIANGDPGGANPGGGISNNGGILTINDCVIDNNVSGTLAFAHGGGIYQAAGTLNINKSTIKNNDGTANGKGGGIYIAAGTAILTNCTVSNNQTLNNAGAIYAAGTSILSLINCTVINNKSGFNTGAGSGGVFKETVVTLNLTNTILANNTVGIPTFIFNSDLNSFGTTPPFTNNNNIVEVCLQGGGAGSCPVFASNADPLLAPLAICGLQDIYRPTAGSAAINGGTLTGAPTTDICGNSWVGLPEIGNTESVIAATTLDCDGTNDYVDIGTPYTAFTNELSVEAWINVQSISGDGAGFGQATANVDNMSTNVWMMHLNSGTNTISFYVNDGGTWRLATSTTTFNGTGWHHIVGTANASETAIWVDGSKQGADAGISTGIQNNPASKIHLGKDVRYNTPASRYLDGKLDEVRIWNKSLCFTEISGSSNCQLVGNEPSLVHYYNFNQGIDAGANGSETTLLDRQTNLPAQNGTLTNFGLTGTSSNWIDDNSNVSGTCTTINLPEVDIQGNGVSIISGDVTPSTADDTDFGNVDFSSGSVVRTFTIDNSAGTAPLTFLGPGVISSNSTDFTLGGTPPSTVPAGGSTTFTITFDPASAGVKTSTITVATNDCNEDFYTFTVQGTGITLETVAITEWIANPTGTDATLEWVELYNYGSVDVDIMNWSIKDEDTDNDIIIGSSHIIPPGGYAIVTNSKSTFEATWFNGCAKANVIEVGGLSLTNSGDEIILEDDLGTTIWSVAYTGDGTEGRATHYTESPTFTNRFWGSKATPGVVRNGNDVTTTLGYERNDFTADPNAVTAANGDIGSPMNGSANPPEKDRGTALTFNGTTDHINLGNITDLNFDFNQSFSVELWANVPSSAITNGQFISKFDGLLSGWYCGFLGASGTINFGLSNLGFLEGIEAQTNVGFDIRDGQWHHIAISYDGSGTAAGITIYIDGIANTTVAANLPITNPITNTANALIGNHGGLTEFFTGNMDEVRVWNTERTATQIRENMHLTLTGCEAGGISYFQMNENSGTTITDAMGSNNGTFVGTPTWATSGVNVGNDLAGTSVSQTISSIPTGASSQTFPTANVAINLTAHSGVEDFTATYQAFTPNATLPVDLNTIHQNPMWTINKASSTETFTGDITFTYPVATITATNPCQVKLYHRTMGSDGNWTEIASQASAVTNTTATFTGITTTGQFMIAESGTPDIVRDRVLDFDGVNDNVNIPDNPSLDIVSAITLEAWVNQSANGGWDMIVDKRLASDLSCNYGLGMNGGQPSFYFRNGVWTTHVSGTTIPLNEWHHVAATYDGSNVRIYLDGVQIYTAAESQTLIPTNESLKIGDRQQGGQAFAGKIDEVRIWNIARTEQDIRENMHLTLEGCEIGLVSYYQMNETPGTNTISDKVGSNSGDLNGFNPVTAWVAGGVNVGNDATPNSNSQTILGIAAGASTQVFGAANMTIEYTAHSGAEDVTVTYQNFAPNSTAGATGTPVSDPMWTINKSSSTETQTMNLSFNFPTALSSADICDYKLYGRTMGSDAAWTLISGAATSLTGTRVTFGGVTTTGQFMVSVDPTVAADIVRDQTLSFDGADDFVNILTGQNTLDFERTNPVTFEAWVNTNSTGMQAILSKVPGGAFDWRGWEVGINNNNIYFFLNSSWATSNTLQVTTTSNAVSLGSWHHIAVTYDGSSNASGVNIHIDGVLQPLQIDFDALSGTTVNTTYIPRVGARVNNVLFFNGSIDEVRVWNTTRTEQDIRENMHLTLAGCEQNLIAYYQMNEGSGTTVLDKSGNGNDGTIAGATAPTWVASGVNVGQDAAYNSNSQTITGITTGVQIFAAANLNMSFDAHSAAEDFTVTYQEFTPNAVGGIDAVTLYQNPMWTINKSTTTETFLATLDFNFPSAPFTTLDPTKYGLYWRPMNSDGNWTKVCAARAVTANTIKFGNVSLVGQFMVVMESEPLVSDVRGNMYDFDGVVGTQINIPATPDFDFAVGTVETWIKPEFTTNANKGFLSMRDAVAATNTRWSAHINVGANTIGIYNGSAFQTITPTITLASSTWYHIALVMTAANTEVFLNGVSQGFTGNGINVATTGKPFVIGSPNDPPFATEYFQGKMDEVRVWNSALSRDQIRENMHLTLKGNEAGLVAYYQFNNDDPAGTANGVKDAMGGYDGTTVNMTTADYLASEVAVAGGASDRTTIPTVGTNVNFPNTNVDIEFGATTPDGEIVVYRLETEKPHGWSTISGDVDNEYFVVRNFGNNTTFDALVDITFNRMNYIAPADVGVAQGVSPLQVFKRNSNAYGPSWGTSLGGSDNGTAGSNGSVGYNASNGITSFSQIVVVNTGPNSDLPVEFLNFEATRMNADQVELQWSTASETNNQGFHVERMLEHETEFQAVAWVEGNGTTVTTNYYQSIDANDYANISYYRLKQVDFDGTISYSDIRSVTGKGNNNGAINIAVYPNPVKDNLSISFDLLPKGVKSAKVRIMSVSGKLMHEFDASVTSYQQIDISFVEQLTPAVYMLFIELDNGENMVQKFIKD